MPAEPRTMADPRSLRAIAHPVRNRLLYELAARGAARAVDLAEVIDVPANAVSFHLRELAKYDLIEPAPGRSQDRRDRWWRLASASGFRFRVEDFDEAGRAMARTFGAHSSARVHGFIERFFELTFAEPRSDVGANQFDAPMFLTRAEVDELGTELGEVLTRWMLHGRERNAAGDTEGRTTYLTLCYTMPQDLADPTSEEPRTPGPPTT